MQVHSVSQLYIYPIKSLGGIAVQECKALIRGFEYDRRWMLVNNTGRFLSQRENAQLALFSCQMKDGRLVVSYKSEELSIDLEAHTDNEIEIEVWSDKFQAYEVDKETSEWFSEQLDQPVRLVKMTEASLRPKQLKVAPHKTELSFADGYPYLILGDASMQALNSHLDNPLPLDRFRANIIVTTTQAHEEDKWQQNFQLGQAKLKVIKPCARCVVTTIDQRSGEKGKEPLKSLATYRQWDNKIWFGANAICTQEGIVSVGDRVVF